MGPQPPCLKIASGALLKMLALQLTFGRGWQAIKPKLKIGAAGRGWGGVVTRQQGPGLVGAEGDWAARAWATGTRRRRLCFQSGPALRSPAGYPALCWKDSGSQKARTREGNGYGETQIS